jgi:hypothetical protein
MRGSTLTAAVVAVLGVSAPAALGQSPYNTMPGTPVGSPSVQPVGQPVGTRLPTVGQKVGTPPTGYPKDATSPFAGENWPKIDPKQVVAPYPTPQGQADSFWDKLYKRWLTIFPEDKAPKPTYTPGIARRNRERAEKREQEELTRRMRD